MSANRWFEITYYRVPSVCIAVHELPDRCQSGKKQISGATLFRHLLVMQAVELVLAQKETPTRHGFKKHKVGDAMREQRRKLAKTQALVVDAHLQRVRVNEISGKPPYLTSHHLKWIRSGLPFPFPPSWRSAKPPFADSFIAFSSQLRVVVLDPESKKVSLGATIQATSRSEWGFNSDFDAVFLKLVLPSSIKNKVPKDETIKRIFVFSDMQFNCASTRYDPANWETNRDVVERAYQEAGEGIALLSGYSPSLLEVFMGIEEEEEDFEVLDNSGENVTRKQDFTPQDIRKYNGLVVVD
ncbi:hypothetical protein PAXINDRAFT_16092 [Paxillus involutus ATCC 200175]|uniref:DUF7788 domain-containing protein n=1 Tax=Paxillus involutus ATCC 200175 TaxID=664439 RepID=A0A0C9TT09_PAXIN|nr:hypothetical protein PAXINDRAFT_16092 [Paxillus involutus ATCC 200175]